MELIKEIEIGSYTIIEDQDLKIDQEFIDKVSILDVVNIEPLLDEDVKVLGRLEKYEFLAMIRDIFLEFKKYGDTKILVREGTCGLCGADMPKTKYTARRPIKKVIEMKGNNSNQKFHFAVLGKEGDPLKFKICRAFLNQCGAKEGGYGEFSDIGRFADEKQSELSRY